MTEKEKSDLDEFKRKLQETLDNMTDEEIIAEFAAMGVDVKIKKDE